MNGQKQDAHRYIVWIRILCILVAVLAFALIFVIDRAHYDTLPHLIVRHNETEAPYYAASGGTSSTAYPNRASVIFATPQAETAVEAVSAEAEQASAVQAYVLNTSSKKFHLPECSESARVKETNRKEVQATRDDLLTQGYQPCKKCSP